MLAALGLNNTIYMHSAAFFSPTILVALSFGVAAEFPWLISPHILPTTPSYATLH